MQTTTKKSASEVLEKKSNGYLTVEANGDYHWRSKLRLALRDADRLKNAWGNTVSIYDCETKERLYRFGFLGADL